ncbi:MAG: alkaline phosphatase PhoX, partial [Bacteroidota bacterium]
DAILGYGGNGEVTTLDFGSDPADKYITTYLRHTFEVADAAQYDSLLFDLLRDDGAIVYLNGTEVFRQNMPDGEVTYAILASGAVGGSGEDLYFREKVANLLVDGRNVIAVELHQASPTSSDLSFDLLLNATFPPLGPASFPIARGSAWHYLDEGVSLDGVDWRDQAYATADDAWLWGNGALGYGDEVATEIRFGNDPDNKFITTYFRREVNVDLATLPDSIQLAVRRDDGVIVYLNGEEVFRDNMPEGDVDYLTLASATVGGSDELNYYGVNLYPEQFRQGINTIAVEVHQASPSSSDLVFDLTLDEAPVVNPPGLGCADGNEGHIACFTSIAPTAQTPNLIIAGGSHRFQAIHKQGSNYSIGSGTVPGNHDFTAFVGAEGNTSSTAGYLSINHETSPGGVSMLGLHYDADGLLWVVDSSQAVDFYNDDLVTTTRNCSGGITPWGTVITAEESLNNTDANDDGYTDVGWLVEIDPVTARVMEYGNGKQEKLWAVGRVSHENTVILEDEVTLFTGEDGGSSAVFKFVADNPRDLTSGKLYALQLNDEYAGGEPSGTTGTWIEIPNSTPEERNNTRALAISLGATNFRGVEDIEVSPLTGEIYFTSKGWGRVYRFTDGTDGVTGFETFVGGASYVLNTEDGVFTEPWRGGNDNLTFDNQGNLWVLQDGGLNYIWVVRADHTQASPKVELFASMPNGSEPCGLTFTPDNKFGFFSVQHPSRANLPQLDATGNEVAFDASMTVIFSRSEFLGAQPPAIAFEADRRVVIQGEKVTFNDLSANGVDERQWVFDGGVPAVSAEESVEVTYNGLGFYTVSLTVENAQGDASVVEEQYIEVIQPAPVTDFTANNIMVAANAEVTFFDLSSNNPTSWNWTFDGAEPAASTDSMPTVTYAEPGLYSVSLETANRAGNGTVTKTEYIEVMRTVGTDDPVGRSTNLNVYPNPTTGRINIRMDETAGKRISFELFDLTGRRLSYLGEVNGIGGTGIWSYDANELAAGAKAVVLKVTLDGKATHRVIQLTR